VAEEFRTRVRPITESDFAAVRELARNACGINLHEGKKALVSSRLEKLVRGHGFDTFTDYIGFVSHRKQSSEFTEFIDTLTTNHSGFWREPEHFIFLQKNIFPEFGNGIRIWSAACATGEEPYTLAMCALAGGIAQCRISATDISRTAMNAAIRGEYDRAKVSALPNGWPERFFSASGTATPGMFRVVPAVKSLVSFVPLNLLNPFGHMGQFDVIFCRNVMIYFEQPTRDRLVERLVGQLPSGGYLFTGHSETLLRLPPGLKYVQPATYRKV
jgi:chemotaxis protein methyltransferase CheR